MTNALQNWAGNVTYGAARVHQPKSVGELQQIVRGATKLRALGSRHSFNRIADTDGDLVVMSGLNRVLAIDPVAMQVTVDGGITYGELTPVLDAKGLALANLASLPHISVVGATATATHGSGNTNRNLSAAIAALAFVGPDGELVRLKRGDADFAGAVVHLGALGPVAEVTLDLVPRFAVRQHVYVDMPVSTLADNFEAIYGAAYSVSSFLNWSRPNVDTVWLKALATAPTPPDTLFGAAPATRNFHPITTLAATPCTEQMGVPGPWHLRLPHFRMEFSPSAGAEIQSEYFIARKDAAAAIRALHAIGSQISGPLMISEIRTMAADDLWLSCATGRDTLGFHFTWVRDWQAVQAVLPLVEAALAPFAPRAHWGKTFTMPKETLLATYPRLGDFRALVARHDPAGKFRNGFLSEIGI